MDNVIKFLLAALPWITLGIVIAAVVVINSKNRLKEKAEDNYASEGMAIGMCMGVALGSTFFDNTGIGISLGMLIGLMIGSTIKK